MTTGLVVAVPKGRVLKAIIPLLEHAGLPAESLADDDRTLVRTVGPHRFLLLKPDDVPTYVEHGSADLGICGRDVVHERAAEVFIPLDLGVGKCRLVVAGPRGASVPSDVPRVATKFTRLAKEHFAKHAVPIELIHVAGSVELAPNVGLSDVIVDLVESGRTLAENDLEVIEVIMEVSSVVIANRASFRLKHDAIADLVNRLRSARDAADA